MSSSPFSFRPRFTRESIIEGSKTAAWVIVVTLLIWVYAEREQITEEPNVPIVINLRCGSPNLVATMLSPQERVVQATLSGPKGNVDKVKQALSGGTTPTPVEITLSSTTPGTRDIAAVPLLAIQPIFRDNAVTVTACAPGIFKVAIDEVIEREAKVVAPRTLVNLDGPASFDPPLVKIRGPRAALEQLSNVDAQGTPLVTADLAPYVDVLATAGAHEIPNVKLAPVSTNPNVKVEPNYVTARFTIRRADVTTTLQSVPIFPYAPRSLTDEYKIEFVGGDTLPNVTVSGPPDEIQALGSGKFKPTAMLPWSREDIPTGGGSRAPTFIGLPPHVTVAPADQSRKVEFRLTKRAAGE